MKKLIVNILLLSTALFAQAQYRTGYSDLEDSETVKAMKEHVAMIASASMEGRLAGSEGEKSTAEYVRSVMEGYGVDMIYGKDGDVFGITGADGDTLTSRNMAGIVQGYDSGLRDRYIVVGARMDNLGAGTMMVDGQTVPQIYSGANGNASGLALMMELARMVSTNAIMFRRSLIFIAFGASRQSFAGSWYFINRSFPDPDKIDAMIDLDMLGAGEGFYAYTASNGDLDAILSSMSNKLLPVMPEVVTSMPYPSDNIAFYDAGIPSVYFTTGLYPEHDTPKDSYQIIDFDGMERELEYLYQFTLSLADVDTAPSFRNAAAAKSDEKAYSFTDCDTKPSFMGHTDPRWFMTRWVYQYLKYPQEAIEQGIQGRVNVQFNIEKDGKVSNVRVVKSADPLLDAAAVKVVEASPKWKAGKVDGKTVRSYVTIPVDFKLTKGRKFGIKK